MSEDSSEVQLSPEEQQEMAQYLQGYGAPTPEEKHNVHKFISEVAKSKDTTKTGYLKDEEIGMPRLPVRTYKVMSLVAEKIMKNPMFAEYFKAKSEILTSTSLSRDAKLLELAVVQRREMADVTKKQMKKNSGWFTKKDKESES